MKLGTLFLLLLLALPAFAETKSYKTYDSSGHYTGTIREDDFEDYTVDGKLLNTDERASLFHDEVTFEVPPPPKRMVEKEFRLFLNLYPEGASYAYRSRQEADNAAGYERIGDAEEIIITRMVEDK